MYVGYQRLSIGAGVTNLAGVMAVPAGTVRAQLQVDLLNVRYTADGATNPAVGVGMLLIVGLAPEWFEITDLQNMLVVSTGASSGLNIHYWAPDTH